MSLCVEMLILRAFPVLGFLTVTVRGSEFVGVGSEVLVLGESTNSPVPLGEVLGLAPANDSMNDALGFVSDANFAVEVRSGGEVDKRSRNDDDVEDGGCCESDCDTPLSALNLEGLLEKGAELRDVLDGDDI